MWRTLLPQCLALLRRSQKNDEPPRSMKGALQCLRHVDGRFVVGPVPVTAHHKAQERMRHRAGLAAKRRQKWARGQGWGPA